MKTGCGPDGLKEQGSEAVRGVCVLCEQRAHTQLTPTPRGYVAETHVQGEVLWLYCGRLSAKQQKTPVGNDPGEWL